MKEKIREKIFVIDELVSDIEFDVFKNVSNIHAKKVIILKLEEIKKILEILNGEI